MSMRLKTATVVAGLLAISASLMPSLSIAYSKPMGNVKMCVVVQDVNGQVLPATRVMNEEFNSDDVFFWNFKHTGSSTQVLPTSTFSANDGAIENLGLLPFMEPDAICVTQYSVDAPGHLFYKKLSQYVHWNNRWTTPMYNDNFQKGVSDLSSFGAYGSGVNADGYFNLTTTEGEHTVVAVMRKVW